MEVFNSIGTFDKAVKGHTYWFRIPYIVLIGQVRRPWYRCTFGRRVNISDGKHCEKKWHLFLLKFTEKLEMTFRRSSIFVSSRSRLRINKEGVIWWPIHQFPGVSNSQRLDSWTVLYDAETGDRHFPDRLRCPSTFTTNKKKERKLEAGARPLQKLTGIIYYQLLQRSLKSVSNRLEGGGNISKPTFGW